MRGNAERLAVIQGATINASAQTPFSKEFPMGEGWYAMFLTFIISFTVGTGTTAKTEGELLIIKNVLLRTDRGEILCNLPGRALWKIAALKNGALPYKDAIAASDGTYRVHLPIYFCDPDGTHSMLRPEDTILNTKRYNSVSLQVTYGAVSDLLGTVGSATMAVTMDVEIERTYGVLPGAKPGDGGQPIGFKNYDFRPPVDANSTQSIDVERASDMSLMRLYVHTSSSGTGGVPWSGTNADDRIDRITLKDQSRFIEKERQWRQLTYQNKVDSALESVLTGVGAFNFCRDKSIASALATADKSLLQLTWSNGTAAANNIVTATQEAIRTLK